MTLLGADRLRRAAPAVAVWAGVAVTGATWSERALIAAFALPPLVAARSCDVGANIDLMSHVAAPFLLRPERFRHHCSAGLQAGLAKPA